MARRCYSRKMAIEIAVLSTIDESKLFSLVSSFYKLYPENCPFGCTDRDSERTPICHWFWKERRGLNYEHLKGGFWSYHHNANDFLCHSEHGCVCVCCCTCWRVALNDLLQDYSTLERDLSRRVNASTYFSFNEFKLGIGIQALEIKIIVRLYNDIMLSAVNDMLFPFLCWQNISRETRSG